jgi:hypothetical protein
MVLNPVRQRYASLCYSGCEIEVVTPIVKSIKYLAQLFCLIGPFCCLSWLAVYGFWVGAWLFHSVALARACDAIGHVFLFPATAFLWLLGGFNNSALPLFEPLRYAAINGALIGIAVYVCCRKHRGTRN